MPLNSEAMQRHQRLVQGLLQPAAYPHPVTRPVLLETHISSVILTGEHAYKLKKPLDLGFLDFRDADRRRHFCEEELRLNRRMAPQLYLRLAPVRGSLDRPRVDGEGPLLEYAVCMRQFDPAQTLDRLLRADKLQVADMDRFVDRLVELHQQFPCAPADSDYGQPQSALEPMLENFRQIAERGPRDQDPTRLSQLRDWTLARHQALLPVLRNRREAGRVRECHGDLHLGNLVLYEGDILAFDALEFAPGLRWIDLASELAFLTMDLVDRGAPELSRRCLNRYLDASGDWQAALLMDWYQCYRALVRAKVAAIRLQQAEADTETAQRTRADFCSYVQLAERFSRPPPPALVLMHGVSGSGKSHLAQQLVEQGGFLRLRADVERKRIAGLAASENSAGAGLDLYTPEHGQRTYAHLLELAEMLLRGGRRVVVDATFLRREQRRGFLDLAARLAIDCHIIALDASTETLEQRIKARARGGADPSEADIAVMHRQLQAREPLDAAERQAARILEIDPTRSDDADPLARFRC